jgi:long-subunit fatty acid transport protein
MKTLNIKYLYRYIAVLVSFFLFSSISFSQGVSDALRVGISGLGPDARALGMGDSYIGLSDDASATFFNPAGFGLLKRIEFSGGLDYTNSSTNTNFFNNNVSGSNSATRLNNLSLALPFPTTQGSLVFGISYHQTNAFENEIKFNGFNSGNNSYIQYLTGFNSNTPYNLYLSYPLYDNQGRYLKDTSIFHGNLNQSGDILNSGSIDNWTFSGAVEVAENLFVGLNLNIINGDFTSNNDYYEDDTHNLYQGATALDTAAFLSTDFQTFHLNQVLNWGISGWNAKVGMLYQLKDNARLGITIQFPKTYDIKENFEYTGESYFANTSYTYAPGNSPVKYSIVTPYEIGAGMSVNLKGLILSGQATLIDYSQLKFDNPDGLSQQYIDEQNKTIKDVLGPVINYNLGAEYTIPDQGIRLRVGYIGEPSPYKNDPPKYSRKYITGGVGFLFAESFAVDLGYAHGWWSTYGDNYSSGVSQTFQDISLDKLILTTTFRF